VRSVDEHIAAVLERARPLEPLDVSLLDARGCVLADAVTAPWPLPPFDAAAVPGYAVLSADVAEASAEHPVQLEVVDDVPAGYRASHPLQPGQAIRIGSGAPLPEGADAIAAEDATDGGMPVVSVREAVLGDSNVRRAGEDLPAGHVVIEAGAPLGAREVALLAAVGRARVRVHPKPRVVVITTGTELVEPGAAMTPGLIADSTGYLLTAAAEDAGALAYRAGPVVDEPQALRDALEDQQVRADILVTTGGITASSFDVLANVLEELGTVDFVHVAMSPGPAQGHGYMGPDEVPIFALPGAPASAFVAFDLFVRPVIRRLLGLPRLSREPVTATLSVPCQGTAGARRFLSARLDEGPDGLQVTPIPERGLQGLRLADSLLVVPEATGDLPAGAECSVLPLVER
jgi:molybdopterin molybdotransferase